MAECCDTWCLERTCLEVGCAEQERQQGVAASGRPHLKVDDVEIALGVLNRKLHELLLVTGLVTVEGWNSEIAPKLKGIADVLIGSPIHARSYRVHDSTYPQAGAPSSITSLRESVRATLHHRGLEGLLALSYPFAVRQCLLDALASASHERSAVNAEALRYAKSYIRARDASEVEFIAPNDIRVSAMASELVRLASGPSSEGRTAEMACDYSACVKHDLTKARCDHCPIDALAS